MTTETNMQTLFDRRVTVPDDVLLSELEGESVILNLKSAMYFGLDAVGTRIWAAVTTADSIQAAYDALRQQYDVDPERLRDDLSEIVGSLAEHGLVELQS